MQMQILQMRCRIESDIDIRSNPHAAAMPAEIIAIDRERGRWMFDSHPRLDSKSY